MPWPRSGRIGSDRRLPRCVGCGEALRPGGGERSATGSPGWLRADHQQRVDGGGDGTSRGPGDGRGRPARGGGCVPAPGSPLDQWPDTQAGPVPRPRGAGFPRRHPSGQCPRASNRPRDGRLRRPTGASRDPARIDHGLAPLTRRRAGRRPGRQRSAAPSRDGQGRRGGGHRVRAAAPEGGHSDPSSYPLQVRGRVPC
jgi:hypothetical protein